VSDLQCPARILLVRPDVDPSALIELAAREHVSGTITGPGVDLAEVADLHRGETVLVLADEGPHVERGSDLVLVEIDADGWRVTDLSTDLSARDA
jgi:hypothetical protein